MEDIRQKYIQDMIYAEQLLVCVMNDKTLLENLEVTREAKKLQDCLMLPKSIENLLTLEQVIQTLKQAVESFHKTQSDGEAVGYMKVKKSGNGFVSVDEEPKDIEVPNYHPFDVQKSSLRQTPDYIFHDKVIRVSGVTPANRGSSHVLMLAFLSFFFESIFLVLSFLLYKG